MKRVHSQLGIAAAILVPAVAVGLTTPNVFSDGEVLTAAKLNENFAAIEDDVNSLRSEVLALQSDVSNKATTQAVSSLQGTVSAMDSQLTAMSADVSSLAANIATLQNETAELADGALTGCGWYYQGCSDTEPTCTAYCPAGTYAVSGGCDGVVGQMLTEVRPFPVSQTSFPANGASITAYNATRCRGTDIDALESAFVLCCSNGI